VPAAFRPYEAKGVKIAFIKVDQTGHKIIDNIKQVRIAAKPVHRELLKVLFTVYSVIPRSPKYLYLFRTN
jgi:hypothetical protein